MKSRNGLPLIYCAIDTKDLGLAKELSAAMGEVGCGTKLGLEFFNMHGPQGVQMILEQRVKPSVFLDLKYHDIPNTVAGAIESAAPLDVAYLNVHASGGYEMMRVAKLSCAKATRLLAVTVLTSLNDSALEEVGQPDASQQVQRLASLTAKAGLDGVVCSAHEIKKLFDTHGPEFTLMVPGIRPAGSDAGDQKRVMTPAEAVSLGATHLVIGRPITSAKNPADAARDIIASIAA
ncbi:MAG: orotidine-5'-phosphate decarboxylase [Micavibrio aeruginosavorus]|uniref:Orotidine 5'-phosphate decarboxylase n=1 Tax=Micavibrio aeruginosavorus TaxID=349221 RepID=A0A2W5PV31_9BACT|nr:MAG: orotidine-5'-phosphate decarboxylase [Micavibrio aeruginosavorus]